MQTTISILLLGENNEIALLFEETLGSNKNYDLILLDELGTEEEKDIATTGSNAPKVILIPCRQRIMPSMEQLLSCLKKKFVMAKLAVYFYDTPDATLLCHYKMNGVDDYFMFHEYRQLPVFLDNLLNPHKFTSCLQMHIAQKVCESKAVVQHTLHSLRTNLGERQLQIVEILMKQPKATNQQIANEMGIELSTFEKHFTKLLRYFKVKNKMALLIILEKMKWVGFDNSTPYWPKPDHRSLTTDNW